MREILVRGKRIGDGEWVEGFYCEFANNRSGEQEHFIQTVKPDGRIDTLYKVYPATVGQYTGLTDKHGKRIFEGDVIKYDGVIGDYPCFGKICFGDYLLGHLGFYVTWSRPDDARFLRPDLGFWVKEREVEVIGNIHDNPELLEGGKDGA